MAIDSSDTQTVATVEKWKKAFDKVFVAIVDIRVTATRIFDTQDVESANASGFIVDKRHGIILTNRHVIRPGPVVAQATFFNGEDMEVYPLYRDPVHDFGFFRFDPAALQFLKCEEIPLAPEAAAVGLEIRVVGNDSSEKLSVIPGTLDRLDINAPTCAYDGYNDFNTFYMEAASRTSGGSSGSPVIDVNGQAVALNAAGIKDGCTAYFLPLDRVVRALRIIQKCRDEGNSAVHIPRGTLQMTLVHKQFDEARRLGFQSETEKLVREAFAEGTGILVIDSVVPGGPADKMQLQVGDLLVTVNDEILTHFLNLETMLDDNVGNTIHLGFERGGVPLKVSYEVQDLHSITPNYFLEVSGGVIHPLSYQQARNFNINCGLVYVAEPGYMLSTAGVPRHAIIKSFEGEEINEIKNFIDILSSLSREEEVLLEYAMPYDGYNQTEWAVVIVDRQEWYAEPQLYTRDDATGLWRMTRAIPSSLTNFYERAIEQPEIPREIFGSYDCQTFVSNAERVIEPTLVLVQTYIPPCAVIDGVHAQRFSGMGVVIYHSDTMGIVAVDKYTVPVSISDVYLTFAANTTRIAGDVIFLHPVHNYALVAYNPAKLSPSRAAAVRAAVLRPEPALQKGDAVYLVALNQNFRAQSRKSIVRNTVTPLNITPFFYPRYRAMNLEVIELDTHFGEGFPGVLADEDGRVQALWACFSRELTLNSDGLNGNTQFVSGIPIDFINEVLYKIINGTDGPCMLINGQHSMAIPLVRFLGVELYSILLSKSSNIGLTEKWVSKLAKHDPVRRQVLQVKSCWSGLSAKRSLEEGDMLLAIDGKPITSFRDIENACKSLDDGVHDQNGNLKMTIFRGGSELELLVGTDVRDGFGTTEIVCWCGCIVQNPYLGVADSGFFPREGHGVYVSHVLSGSPVQRYGLYSCEWIVEVNGEPTPDLRTFVDVKKKLENEEFIRVKTIQLSGKANVLTLKQDPHYWPSWELNFDFGTATWRRKTI